MNIRCPLFFRKISLARYSVGFCARFIVLRVEKCEKKKRRMCRKKRAKRTVRRTPRWRPSRVTGWQWCLTEIVDVIRSRTAKELRRKKRALSTCGKNNTRESKPQPDHRLLAISSRRDTWCLRTPVSAPFQPLLLSISPRQGHARRDQTWSQLKILPFDSRRGIASLTIWRPIKHRIEISREGRNIKES